MTEDEEKEYIRKKKNDPDNQMGPFICKTIEDIANLRNSVDKRFSAIENTMDSLKAEIEKMNKEAMTRSQLAEVFEDLLKDMKDGSFWKGTRLEDK